jgi:hypothetical protein
MCGADGHQLPDRPSQRALVDLESLRDPGRLQALSGEIVSAEDAEPREKSARRACPAAEYEARISTELLFAGERHGRQRGDGRDWRGRAAEIDEARQEAKVVPGFVPASHVRERSSKALHDALTKRDVVDGRKQILPKVFKEDEVVDTQGGGPLHIRGNARRNEHEWQRRR